MDAIGLFFISLWVIFVILGFYLSALTLKMRAIFEKNKIKTNYFTFY